jgi:hypothetical protein
MKHLKYSYWNAYDCKELRHAQEVMEELGITYQDATPQSMGDSFWFWNCENIPDNLPSFITELNADPMKCIRWGLSRKEAISIRDYKK